MTVTDTSAAFFPGLGQQALYDNVTAWLAERVPADWMATMSASSTEQQLAFQKGWFASLVAAGLAVPHWPVAYGGGYSLEEQSAIHRAMLATGAPRLGALIVSQYQMPAALVQAGDQHLMDRHLRRVTKEGVVWCQGFSEPGAGSDLAGLRTRATLEGEVIRINGHKIWSSFGHLADWCLLLARTDPDVPKHRGLSLVLVDMTTRGVEARPIRQSTGSSKFAELRFDDVVVPRANLVGQPGQGWKLAMGVLAAERGPMVLDLIHRLGKAVSTLESDAQNVARHSPLGLAPGIPGRLARLRGDAIALRRLAQDMLRQPAGSPAAAADSSVVKLVYSQILRRVSELGVELSGLDGQVVDREPLSMFGGESQDWMLEYVNSWSWTIAGGTTEIQKTLIGERILGLPKG